MEQPASRPAGAAPGCRQQVIVLNEPTIGRQFWLAAYFHDAAMVLSEERAPSIADLEHFLDVSSVQPLLVPADCTDGFIGANWVGQRRTSTRLCGLGCRRWRSCRPNPSRGISRLAHDLANGVWDAPYGHLRMLPSYDVGYRLVICGVE